MGGSNSRPHGVARAAAVFGFCGLIAACSPVPGEPAPVYMMGGRPSVAYQPVASAPMPRAVAPVASAPSPGPSTSLRHSAPDVIPLDSPPPARSASSTPTPVRLAAPPALASSSPPTAPLPVHMPTEPESAKADPAALAASPHRGHFAWPLNGRILAGYGVSPSGGRNDGISIAAPRGAPIAAIEAGTVAYTGNELRGYGNLILIKHADGWISAYAHCDELLVKKGDQVHRGSVIAKVGATGNVNEPQLYFELRRGKQPVDPRQFLATAPVALNSLAGPVP
jgi:murein DD-endopeptidase MepM/ murein hydrolase activator NlpD